MTAHEQGLRPSLKADLKLLVRVAIPHRASDHEGGHLTAHLKRINRDLTHLKRPPAQLWREERRGEGGRERLDQGPKAVSRPHEALKP